MQISLRAGRRRLIAVAVTLGLGVAGYVAAECYSYSNSRITYVGGVPYCGDTGGGCTECSDGGGGSCVTNGASCVPNGPEHKN